MARFGMFLGAVAALHLVEAAGQGTCLLQLDQKRGAAWPGPDLALVDRNSSELLNTTLRVPAAVPLAVRVQGTATNGSQKILLGPAWALLVELHVPMRLLDLHTGPYGPMRAFVDRLAKKLAEAGPVAEERLVVLDVRGENKNFSLPSLDLLELSLPATGPVSGNTSEGHGKNAEDVASGARQQEETIVDIEILPMEHPGDLPPAQVLEVWQRQLQDGQSQLRQGSLAPPMKGATLTRVGPYLPVNGSENTWGFIIRNSASKPLFGLCTLASLILMASSLF